MAERRPSTGSKDETFADLLPIVSRELHNRAFPKIRAAGLTNAQFWILKWIAMYGPFTASDLAAYLGIRAPSVTPLVDGLEKRGLIRRVRSVKDRRVVSIRATAKGERLLKAAGEEVARLAKDATRGIAPAELATAASVLRRMADALSLTADARQKSRTR
jgi:DNA-binding MarR family transcriptional regulator